MLTVFIIIIVISILFYLIKYDMYGGVNNKPEKEKFLTDQFSKLIGTYEKGITNSGLEIKKEIVKITVSSPITSDEKWIVHKTIKNLLNTDEVLIYKKTDQELEKEMNINSK